MCNKIHFLYQNVFVNLSLTFTKVFTAFGGFVYFYGRKVDYFCNVSLLYKNMYLIGSLLRVKNEFSNPAMAVYCIILLVSISCCGAFFYKYS